MPPETLKLRTPSRTRLVDDVYRSLEEAILSGRMRPGERIVEAWLSEHLDVSRTTVREALLMLEREGYVVSEPRRGTFVTRLTREEALDLCYNRALLESFAVRAGYLEVDRAFLKSLLKFAGAGVLVSAALWGTARFAGVYFAQMPAFRDETALLLLMAVGAFVYGFLILVLFSRGWIVSLLRDRRLPDKLL